MLDPEPVIPKVSSLVFWAKDKIYSEGVEDTVTPLITEKLVGYELPSSAYLYPTVFIVFFSTLLTESFEITPWKSKTISDS